MFKLFSRNKPVKTILDAQELADMYTNRLIKDGAMYELDESMDDIIRNIIDYSGSVDEVNEELNLDECDAQTEAACEAFSLVHEQLFRRYVQSRFTRTLG